MGLRDRAKELTAGCELMIGRDKGEAAKLQGTPVTIVGFDFLQDGDSRYAVFTIKEDDKHFFFGGKILTDNLDQLEKEGYRAEIEKNGLPVLFGEKPSKDKKKTYTTVEFYPEVLPPKKK